MFFSQVALAKDTGWLKVRVEDCYTDRAISGARIEIRDLEDGKLDSFDYTNSNGYAFFDIEEGEYLVEASYTDYTSESSTANVYEDEVTDVTFCLDEIPEEECELTLIEADIIDSNLYEGDDLEVFVKLRMRFPEDENEAEVTVTVEKDSKPKETKTYYFDYSGDVEGRIFRFSTDDWSNGTYNVYVKAIAEEDCDIVSNTFVESFGIGEDYFDEEEEGLGEDYTPYTDTCTSGYLYVLRCYEGKRQQLFRYSDCSTVWMDVGFCEDFTQEIEEEEEIVPEQILTTTSAVSEPYDYSLIYYSLILIVLVVVVIFISAKSPILRLESKDSRKIPEEF